MAAKAMEDERDAGQMQEVGLKARVNVSGREGVVVEYDPQDEQLTYKVKFADGADPLVDWFARDKVDVGDTAQAPDKNDDQGMAVHPRAAPIGAPRISARPVIVEAIPDLTEELVVINLRHSVACFGLLDFGLHGVCAAFFWASFFRCKVEKCELLNGVPLWTACLIQTALLIGPVCGVIGARHLQRGLVSVYLVFCTASILCKIAVAFTAYSWFFVFLFFHIWITWIVCKFWSALGSIPTGRIAQMRDPDYLKKAPGRFASW